MMRAMHSILLASSVIAGLAGNAFADQPIMNMMPRWDGGWGFQFIEEYRTEDDLLLGDKKVGPGFEEEVHTLHIQGVYTWDKSIRLTAKLPYIIDARREVLDEDGNKVEQRDNGLGDLTLALPIKKYFNLDGRSGSWTLAPQLRIPLSGEDEFEVGDNEWGGGLSFGYETETAQLFIALGAGFWVFDGDEPFEVNASIDLGYNFEAFGSAGQILWETDYRFEDDGSRTVSSGPALYWKFNDTVHGRVEWKHDFYDKQGELNNGNGDSVQVGLGFVF